MARTSLGFIFESGDARAWWPTRSYRIPAMTKSSRSAVAGRSDSSHVSTCDLSPTPTSTSSRDSGNAESLADHVVAWPDATALRSSSDASSTTRLTAFRRMSACSVLPERSRQRIKLSACNAKLPTAAKKSIKPPNPRITVGAPATATAPLPATPSVAMAVFADSLMQRIVALPSTRRHQRLSSGLGLGLSNFSPAPVSSAMKACASSPRVASLILVMKPILLPSESKTTVAPSTRVLAM